MSASNRRELLKQALAAGAAAAFAARPAFSQVLGANERIRIGVVGLGTTRMGGRGRSHVGRLLEVKGAQVAGLCDADSDILGQDAAKLEKQGVKVLTFQDVRKLLDLKDIDAVTVATPNHWHSLIGIWACQAGKDVYVEKPVSHNLWEGRQLVKAARKYRRVVQAGTQARANNDLIEAVTWVRDGNLGRIRYAHGVCYKPRFSIGHDGKGEIPPGLDYDLWSGPVAVQPLRRKHVHYDWHWIYEYGNGDLGNQGIHEMDLARWFLGQASLSPAVISVGGRLGYEDDGQTPNTQLVYHAYEPAPLVFEVRGLPRSQEFRSDPTAWVKHMDYPPGAGEGDSIAVVVHCEGGTVIVAHGEARLFAADRDGKVIRRFETDYGKLKPGYVKGEQLHFENWLSVIRSRRTTDLTADIEQGHLSSGLCHMGMISHRIGKPATQTDTLESLDSHPIAREHYERFREHLARNGIDPSRTPVTLGPWLKMDPAIERFVGDDLANAMLTRQYREPFTVPQEV